MTLESSSILALFTGQFLDKVVVALASPKVYFVHFFLCIYIRED